MSCVLVHFPIILVCDRLDMPGDWLIAHIVGETLYIKYQISILVEYVLMIACAGKGGTNFRKINGFVFMGQIGYFNPHICWVDFLQARGGLINLVQLLF